MDRLARLLIPRAAFTGLSVLILIPALEAGNAWGAPTCMSCYPDAPAPVTWFGGTVWDAADARWEAILGGTWAFDSGVGSSYGQPPFVDPTKDPSLHGTMEGWIGIDLSGGAGGDWSDLKNLANLPDPLTACPCAQEDTVLVFEDLTFAGHNLSQDNIAASPWIDLVQAGEVGRTGRLVEMDYYVELYMLNYVVAQIQAQWLIGGTPSAWAPITAPPRFKAWPECSIVGSPGRFDLSAVIPAAAEQVRIGLGVANYCGFYGDCTGTTNSTPYFDNVRFGVYDVVDLESDGDGVADVIEDGVGGGSGDGNGDSIPDREQRHVVSMLDAAGLEYVTLKLPAGTPPAGGPVFQCAVPIDDAGIAPPPPPEVTLPCGLFGFTIAGLPRAGATTEVTLTLPPGCAANTYYKFGPTPGDPTAHWYDFSWDGYTGAVIYGNTVILTFLDGERGDDDLAADGSITDAGGPAIGPSMVRGACCISNTAGTSCDFITEQACLTAGGTYYGDDTYCGGITAVPIEEGDGTVFIHHVFSVRGCPDPGSAALAALASLEPSAPPYLDAWSSDSTQVMCHQFGVGPESPPIPADFFGPGSDPFAGQVCLKGEPLGGLYGNSDTIIRREQDPFGPCELPGGDPSAVLIEIIELSLVSIAPITVQFNGGATTEDWDVAVDLSADPSPPGTLTAVKTHCNGGTYTSTLPVRPRFTFTKVSDPGQVLVLDTGLEGIPPVILDQPNPQPWATDIGIFDDQTQTSYFHPGYEAGIQETDCDADDNGVHDDCETLAASDPLTPIPLLRVSPNPFRSQTTVQFELDEAADARIAVFDMAGRQVRVLHSGRLLAGSHSVVWEGDDTRGRSVPAGIYAIRVEAGSFVQAGKVLRIQ